MKDDTLCNYRRMAITDVTQNSPMHAQSAVNLCVVQLTMCILGYVQICRGFGAGEHERWLAAQAFNPCSLTAVSLLLYFHFQAWSTRVSGAQRVRSTEWLCYRAETCYDEPLKTHDDGVQVPVPSF